MKKLIVITEVLQRRIEAEDIEEVTNAYKKGDIVLDASDLVSMSITEDRPDEGGE